MASNNNIVVLGAGVVGLTTALLLLQRGYSVTIVAAHMPGDTDPYYISPMAGANWWPVSLPNTREQDWDRITYLALDRLASEVPEAGIHYQDAIIYKRNKDQDTVMTQWQQTLLSDEPWFKGLVRGFRKLNKEEIRGDADSGTRFQSVCINTGVYLAWLVGECRKRGGVFKRRMVKHVEEAGEWHHTGGKVACVVNCTGLLASKLGGVMDAKVTPTRGQIVLVRNEIEAMYDISGTDDGDEECTYLMMRAAGGGTVIGGSYQKGNWDTNVDQSMNNRIMKRAIALAPELVKPGQGIEALDVIRTYAALRPLRIGGVRLEREKIGKTEVVHNYGAGGFGYQASYGMAEYSARLVDEVCGRKGPEEKAKL